jgi:hypothetical protein
MDTEIRTLNCMSSSGIDDFFGHLGSFILDGNFDKLECYMVNDDTMTFTFWVEGERKIAGNVHLFDGPADYEHYGEKE